MLLSREEEDRKRGRSSENPKLSIFVDTQSYLEPHYDGKVAGTLFFGRHMLKKITDKYKLYRVIFTENGEDSKKTAHIS